MEIAVILNAHENTELVKDTINAARSHATEKILVNINGATWADWGIGLDIPAHKMCGFIHNEDHSPYKNVAFGLMHLYNQWPNSDWYCYMEPDVLFCSNEFKKDLEKAEKEKAWMVGTNLREEDRKFPYLERILKIDLQESWYFLGCCMFFHKHFMKKLAKINFFEKFLCWTNEFNCPYFPDYDGYDISEHLYPTLAHHFGGKLYCLSSWADTFGTFVGNFKKYPIRWQPEMFTFFNEASIVHPVKELLNPYRSLSRRRKNDL